MNLTAQPTKLFSFFIFFLCLFFTQNIYSESHKERIINFHSNIEIQQNGCIIVQESIKVFAARKNIQRGIFRTIPLNRKNKYGQTIRLDFHIISVEKNGEIEPYTSSVDGDEMQIRIGNQDRFLPTGVYDYVITYETYGQVGFFDEFDELYWNVTGNGWGFQIEKASATIHLPEGAALLQDYCYTGQLGSTQSECISTYNDSLNTVYFETTASLSHHEGLTVVAAFTKDIIQRPPPPSWSEIFWLTYGKSLLFVSLLLLLSFYYIATWRRHGRPILQKSTIIPSFTPPNGWSPAAIRYLYKRKYDAKSMSATIISLAVKGYLRIEEENSVYTLIKTGSEQILSEEEKEVYSKLFKSKSTAEITRKKRTVIINTDYALKVALKKNFNLKDYFIPNIKYKVWGALFTISALVLAMFYSNDIILQVFGLIFLIPCLLFVSVFLKLKGAFKIFVVFPLAFGMLIMLLTFKGTSFLSGVFIICIVSMYAVYCNFIAKYTSKGEETKIELEGFRMYLKTTEEHRLNILYTPEKTPELYEEMLPYAIALNVENEWGEKFTQLFNEIDYHPNWHNSDTVTFSAAVFASSISGSLTDSINNASATESSTSSDSSGGSWSSGSSGGGSSGGGGGGGGGGGW